METQATTKKAPAEVPQDIGAAFSAVQQFKLHFYQVLYFQKLTDPNSRRPFAVDFRFTGNMLIHGVTITYASKPEYSFFVRAADCEPAKIDEVDARVLSNCQLILEAERQGRVKKHHRVCCPLAEITPCVCTVSYKCGLHGQACVGTHD